MLDEHGNVVNKNKAKVFGKRLLEPDGDIPKIFRAGLLRKDTYDSFSQLMSEIEDLERMQELEEAGNPASSNHGGNRLNDPKMQAKNKRRMEKENQRLQKKIDKIVEDERDGEDGEDDDDEGMLLKELEELANNNGTTSNG